MEENKKQTVEMTAEEAEAFKQFQEKQAKEKAAKKRKEDREAYAQLVDSEIESAKIGRASCRERVSSPV